MYTLCTADSQSLSHNSGITVPSWPPSGHPYSGLRPLALTSSGQELMPLSLQTKDLGCNFLAIHCAYHSRGDFSLVPAVVHALRGYDCVYL